jgi:DNA polymerase elongation subunit (family B)
MTEVRKNIIFKAMYWSFEDTEDNTLIIHVSGMTESQQTVQVQIEKFTPYVYLQLPFKIPGGGNWTNEKCKKVYEYFKTNLKNNGPLSYKLKKKEILHFREEGIFMFLTFSTNKACIEFERRCSRKNFIPGVGMIEDGVFKVHEQNIDPILKFTAMKKLLLAGWICCTKETIHDDEIGLNLNERKFSTADIDFYCHYQNMNPYVMKKTVILHPLYCSFDIECNSQNHNSKLPDPKNPENKVFQISMVFGRFGKEGHDEIYLLSLFNPLDIEGTKVIRFKKEKELLLYFSKLIRKKDPLFFIGYNIMKFDWTYMIERAEKFGYLPKFLDISRIVGKKAELKKSSWSSSAYGEQDFKFPDCFGRTQLDVLVEVERNYRLPTYSLDAVSEKFLDEHKDDITPRQLFMFYKITDDLLEIVDRENITDLQKQIKHILPFRKTHGVVRRHRRKMLNCQDKDELTLLIRECLTMTLRYCKQDTILPIRLVNKLNLLTTMEEMSNVMHVPMSYLHTRGQQIKVLAQIFRETIGENIVIPYNKKDPNKEPENYEGAIVVEANAGDYTNVGTLDFCITGDTLISTGNGLCVPLKDITKDHKVIGWDGNSYNEYSQLGVVYKGEKETVAVWLQDGSVIKCTPDHKFILENGEKCRADELEGKYVKCGDYKDGKYKVSRKKVIGVYKNGIEPVYDIFNVDQVHNFLAGGISVMNCSLYPTTMIAFNICYTTLVRDNNIPDKDCHVLEWTSHVGCPHDPLKRKKKKGDRVIMVCGDYKCRFLKVKYTYDEETGVVIRENEGIMPRLERNLLTSRKEVKKEMFRAEARLAMNRGEATKEDIAFYKKCGIEIIESGSLSKEEDKILETVAGILNAKQLAIKVSANSTSATTPIPCLVGGRFEYKYIEELFDEDNCIVDDKNNEVCFLNGDIKVWSDKGWSNVKYVFRHEINNDTYRVLTHTGCVDVTRDHSLLDGNCKEVTIKDVDVGNNLFHNETPLPEDTPETPFKTTWNQIDLENFPLETPEEEYAFVQGLFFAEGTCGIYGKGHNIKYSWCIYNSDYKLLERARDIINKCDKMEEVEAKIYDPGERSSILPSGKNYTHHIYQLRIYGSIKNVVISYRSLFYNSRKEKKIPSYILNAPYGVRLSYFVGYYCGDGGRNMKKGVVITNKGCIGTAQLYYLMRSLGYKVSISTGKNNLFRLQCCQKFRLKKGFTHKSIKSIGTSPNEKEVLIKQYIIGGQVINKNSNKKYVYDIETSSHHFAAGIGDIIVHNSAYGALGAGQGFIPLIQGAASVTAMGRKLITLAVGKIKKEWSNCKLIYGDSVVGDTPILIRDKNTLIVHIINIHELECFGRRWKDYPLFKVDENDRHEKQRVNIKNIEIWTEKGWSCVKRLIKHKVNKKIYRVYTKNGIVDVTEDHSLLNENSSPVKPKDVCIGEKLLTSFPNYFTEENIYDCNTVFDCETIPFYILKGSHENKIRFLEEYKKNHGGFFSESKIISQKLYYLLKSCGYENLELDFSNDRKYKINILDEETCEKNKITKVEVLYETYDDYVYDIETESGHFHAGIGEIILKNTDSCMIFFEDCTLKECFENCERASRVVTHYLKSWILGVEEYYVVRNLKNGESYPLNKITTKSESFKDLSYEHKIKVIEYESIPTDLTFEKVYGRFLLLTKKRYIAYTVNKDGKIIETTKKGVVLTRRDNSQSLRTTYKKVSDGILDRKEEKEVMYELYDEIHKLFTRQIPETNFIIYLGVKKIIDYAKKKKFMIGNKQEEFFIDEKGHPIEDIVGPLDSRLVYPNLPQVLLSLKLLNRGTDVPPNTRLEHIYVENPNATHQGQKAEDYTYYKENKDVEDFKIDYLHYLEKLQAPISELIKVKYPKKDIILYEKLEDAVKRILSTNNIDEYKRITLSRVSKIVKTVEEYEKYEVGWKVLKKGKIKKFITKKEEEYPRNIAPSLIYEFKGVNAKIEHIIQSSKKDSLNDFTMNNPIEKEMIEISKTYKSRVIIDLLHARYKIKKRPYKKPTQTGEKVIKNTRVKIISGAYEGRYGRIYNLFEIEDTKPKKYTFQVLLDNESKVIENIPREHIVTYRFRDDNIMKDIYSYRCFYKSVVEELKKLFNPVVFEE